MTEPTLAARLYAIGTSGVAEVPAPAYRPGNGARKVFLAMESFKRHMSSEGWQLQAGLALSGYVLCGRNLAFPSLNVPQILKHFQPGTVILQDKREWDPANPCCIDGHEAFENYQELGRRDDFFKLTILKDAQHNGPDNVATAQELGIHGWITYYHSDLVKAIAPYVRKEHLVRTYHTLDLAVVPAYVEHNRLKLAVLSGAVCPYTYPLRARLYAVKNPTHYRKLEHPGYHAKGFATDRFLQVLSRYRVAICTASRYGYALRKIIEASACGCKVITDLPREEVLPGIDGNLVRVSPDSSVREIEDLCALLIDKYNPDEQRYYVEQAAAHFDYRTVTAKLAADIDALRESYARPTQ